METAVTTLGKSKKMCTEKCRNAIAPKKCCCLSLQRGSLLIGILMCIIMVTVLICTAVQVYETSQLVDTTSTFTSRNNYSYAVVAVVYSLFILCLCLWFIWGVIKRKSSVVLSWLVVMTLWVAQTFVLILVLIYLHSVESNFLSCLFAIIFGLLAIGILSGCLLVVLGYWTELKQKKRDEAA